LRIARRNISKRILAAFKNKNYPGFVYEIYFVPESLHFTLLLWAAIMLAAAHERRQAPPYGLVDTNKTIHEGHFSL
jgi:hypothetical protein